MRVKPVVAAASKTGGLILFLTVLLTGLSTAQPELHLEGGSFTPTENSSQAPGLQSHIGPESHEEEYMILQFQGPITQDERDRISEKHEIEFISYIPDYAWITHVSNDRNSIISEETVRTLMPYKPEHRISRSLQEQNKAETGEITVLVEAFKSQNTESMLEEYGSYEYVRGDRWRLETSYSELEGLSKEEHVKWIEEEISEMETHNEESRELIEVDRLHENPFNLRGRGLTANIRDGGEIGEHDDLTYDDKVILEDEDGVSEHATHVAGTMLGAGNLSKDRELRGMAPDARAISYDFNDLGDVMNEVDHSISEYNTILSQNSWGADMSLNDEEVMGSYGSLARDYDDISSGEAGISGSIPFVFSAGNEGNAWEERYNTTTPPSTAKNTITVGAVDSSGEMTSFSSWGPTDDGRIKPTVVADGASVTSTWPENEYETIGGTSMAAPAVSGAALLLKEQFNNSYGHLPEPATVKGTLIHTAEDSGREGPDYRYGWGLVNATAAVEYVEKASERDLIKRGSIQDSDDSETYSINVPEGESVKFTLVWNDYPGTSSAGKHLINDLDLVVENGDGERKYPWTLSWENRTDPALQDRPDRTNPVNQVHVENTETTDYTVTVEGHSVPEGEQEYSLLMTSEEPDYSLAELEIKSPENTSYSETPDFNLSSDKDLAEASYSFGETNSTLEEKNSTFFFDTDRELDEGLYSTTFYGEDLNGNISSEAVSFTLDKTPPQIEVFSPDNNSIKAGDIELEASFEDNLTGVDTRKVSLENDSGVQQTYSPNTSFDSTGFEDGNYDLIFYANDSVGNENSKEINITLSNDAPEIDVLSPLPDTIQRPPFEASASVSSATDVSNSLEIFNEDEEVTDVFNFTVSVDQFDTGNYTFRFNSTDEAGNKTVETVEAGISNPVNLTIQNPENELYGEVPSIEASSNVSMEEAFYNVQNSNLSLGTGTEFEDSSPDLNNGTQTLELWTRDSAGAWFNENITFTVDTAEPDLEPLQPVEDANISGQSMIEASWNNSFSDVNESVYTISNDTISVDGELNGSFDTETLSDGDYTVFFNVTDEAGNTALENRSITVDNTPPEIDILNPENDTVVSGDIDLEASTKDITTSVEHLNISIIGDDGLVESFNRNTTFDTTEVEDANYSILFTANDSAGNEETETSDITVDNEPPEITVFTPEEDELLTPSFNISGLSESSTEVNNSLNITGPTDELLDGFNHSFSEGELETGNYSFKFISEDDAGTVTEKTVEASVSNPANVSIQSPENETYGETPEIEASSNLSMEEAFYSTGEENKTLGSGTSFTKDSPVLDNGSQTLELWTRDSAGAWFNENITFTVDTAEPDLEALRPVEDANVSGDVSVEASWNNSFSEIVESSFNVSGVEGKLNESFDSKLVADGEHTVFYNVTDKAGNTALVNRSITVDNTPPTVDILRPDDGAVLAGEFDVEASVNDSVTGIEYINTTVENESVVAEGQGNSSFDSEQLDDGNYSMVFRANDSAGNIGSSSVEITVDNTAPEIDVVSPDNDKIATPFDVEASWSDESDIEEASFKLVNGTGTQVQGDLNGSVNADDISSGDYTINYTVTDEVGNTAFDEKNVEVAAGPEPEISAPQNITYGHTPDFNISTEKELETAFVEAGENNISLGEKNSSFYSNTTAELQTGRYTAVFNVVDIEGVKDEASKSFTVDKQPPEISDVKPVEEANLSENFTVEASVKDEFSDIEQQRFKVFNSSGPQTDYSSLNSTVDISGLEDGEYTVKLEASDELGNEASVNRTVNLDRTIPSISFDPVNETVSGEVNISFSAKDDGTGLEASWMSLVNESGSQFNTTENTSLDTEAFTDGDYTLEFNAVDRAGNDAVEEEEIEFDNTAPEITVESPVDQYLSGEVWINASVNDSNPANSSYRWMDNGTEVTDFVPVNETFNTSSLEDGSYNLAVKANDTVGNERVLTQEYVVDNTAPELEIELYNYTELENNWVEPGFTAEAKCSSLSNVSEVQASHTGTSTSNSSINSTVDSAGVQHLVFNCTDNADNEASLNQTEFIDGGAPEVEVTVPEEGSTVETEFELDAGIRDETDESGVNSSASFLEISEGIIDNVDFTNTTFTADVSDLDHDTSFSVTGNITDFAGLTHEVNLDFTTESDDSSSSSSSSGGGGGGGGGSTILDPPEDDEEQPGEGSNTRTEDLSEEGTEIDVSDLETPVRSLETSGSGSASFTVQESDSTGPEQASATYRSVEMTFEADDAESTTVNFDVGKDWIQENMVKPENVFLYRQGSEWEKLETEVTGEEDEAYLYKAEVPEFSTFSIAAEEEQKQENFLVEEDGECVEVEAYEEPENVIDNCQEVEAQLQEDTEENEAEEETDEAEEEEDESIGLISVLFAAASIAMLSGFGYGYHSLNKRRKLKNNLEELKEVIGPDPELQYLLSDAEKALDEREYDKSTDIVSEIKNKVRENYETE